MQARVSYETFYCIVFCFVFMIEGTSNLINNNEYSSESQYIFGNLGFYFEHYQTFEWELMGNSGDTDFALPIYRKASCQRNSRTSLLNLFVFFVISVYELRAYLMLICFGFCFCFSIFF